MNVRSVLILLIEIMFLIIGSCRSSGNINPEKYNNAIIINGFEVDDIIVGWFNYNIITIKDSDSNYYAIVSEQNPKCEKSLDKKLLLQPGFTYNIAIKLRIFTDNDKLFSSAIKHKGDNLFISNPSITFYSDGTTSKDIYYIENLCDNFIILGENIW